MMRPQPSGASTRTPAGTSIPRVSGLAVGSAPARAAWKAIWMPLGLHIDPLRARGYGDDIRRLAASGPGFGIVAGTDTGKTLATRSIATTTLQAPLKVGVVNREREA